ncbi:MAG: hypothetical protein OEQ74_08590 [Gammaproteobacteria bacterium]|nr:hypothetical protein [Gammaproteobacteria bacterium]
MFQRNSSLAFICAGLLVSSIGSTQVAPFSDNFESYDPADPETLFGSGWQVFGNVFAPGEPPTHLYGYGPNPAPNDGGAFSGVATGEGGVGQGAQQFNIFNDYNNNDEHTAGNLVEANVFREQQLQTLNTGQTWVFQFDAKRGNIEAPSTALAFIKTIEPVAPFGTSNFITVDMTSTPLTWQTYSLEITIDFEVSSHFLQVGFANTATNFDDSANFYDNVFFFQQSGVDTDEDGVLDDVDNCTEHANADQTDTDGDGHGNRCDGDFDQSCSTIFTDVNNFKAAFLTPSPLHDLDGDGGSTDFQDLAILKALFLTPPGPSADPALCNNGD